MMSFDDANTWCKGRIKSKYLNAEQFFFYKSIISTLLLSKFKIENCPPEIRSDNILKSLMYGGVSAMTNKLKFTDDNKNHNYVGFPIMTGVTQYEDYYEFAQLVNPRGETEKAMKIGEEIAVGYNNLVHTPEFDVLRFALFLTEVDTSMHVNVLNARLSPIFRASSAQESKKFDAIRDDIYKGELSSIELHDFTWGDYTTEPSHIMNLTDVKNVDKIQYLVKLHDDLIRRLCNLHGVTMNTTGKMAQLTEAELNEYSGFSSIYVNQQYDLLCEYIEESNRINNFNMSVKWGTALQRYAKGELKLDETLSEIGKEREESEDAKDDANSITQVERTEQKSNTEPNTNFNRPRL